MTDQLVWRPTASWENLKSRAQQLAYVRGFFAERGVLEVETPLLGRHGVTDVNLEGVAAAVDAAGVSGGWLQTSPEYHMKRLLAAGSGSIFQVARVFRNGERGGRHNPEFSMLEWYRVGFDDTELMEEVADLVCGWLGCDRPDVLNYRDAVRAIAGFDPMTIPPHDLYQICQQWLEPEQLAGMSRDDCLDLVMSFKVEPELGRARPVFVTHYPTSQAALARITSKHGFPVAHRFELYISGLELCNGYWELTDPVDQRQRFEQDNRRRRAVGKPEMTVDQAFLSALDAGLPACSGVALGLDRLLMLKTGAARIEEVLAFPIEHA
ncbi:MAG: EF-P lysine aminoacylase GenX [Marinobacter excellens HL-55]|uniref:EF-P lysine aminoacylase GenX n=1 Tax=Marinobacter excellens HL-55 TaxID=1305731 RepID=A0A0P7ZFN4_9GAMM|nr:MAG: EF-P lysine aminoacylase GenX [Marinobacter excellens HL-55]